MSRPCPNCQSELEEDAKFCMRCGTHVPATNRPLRSLGEEKTIETDEPFPQSLPELPADENENGEEAVEWTDLVLEECEPGDVEIVREKSPDDSTYPIMAYDVAAVKNKPTEERSPSQAVVQPPVREATQDTAFPPSPAVVYLRRLGCRMQQIYRELSVVVGVCLLGLLIYKAFYNHLVGGGLIGLCVLVALYLLLLEPIRSQCREPIDAVRAYFQALGRLLPEYRRMYALLTANSQKTSGRGSYSSFCHYWRYQLSQLKPEGYSHWPVTCSLRKCEVEFDDQHTRATVTCRLEIYLWGRPQERLSVLAIRFELIKASDNVWRIVDGRLPEPPPEQ